MMAVRQSNLPVARLNRVVRLWLPAVVISLFAARCLYEIDPISLSFLGDWPGTLGLSLVVVGLVFGVSNFVGPAELNLAPFWLLAVYVVWPAVDLRWALILLLGTIWLVGQDVILTHFSDRGYTLLPGLIVFALYLITLGDHVGRADTFEFQVAAPQLGIAHPTGYPLYILIGKLFSLLPIGSMAFRVNLTSAIFATLAVTLVFRLIRSMSSDRWAAAIAALTLAATPAFWSQAIVAEVYALNALFVAIILTLLVSLNVAGSIGSIDASPLQPSQDRLIYLLFFVFGLALTHHLTTVILMPAIALALILLRPGLRLKNWLIAVGCLLLGLTPWLYIPLRWPALHNGASMALGDWLGWIFGQRFGGALNLALWNNPTRWGIVGRITLEQFGPVGLALAAIGLLVLLRRRWRMALTTLVVFAGYIFYGLVYNVPDADVFIIPAFMILAIWLGMAIACVAQVATRWLEQEARRILHSAFRIMLLLLPLSFIAANFSAVNQHGVGADLEAWGRYVLSLPIRQNAAILVDSEKIAPLYYLQVTEQLRPDLDILVLGDEALYRQELDRRLAAGQPVYLARFLPNLPYRMGSLGPLVEVSRGSIDALPSGRQIGASFGNSIDLLSAVEEHGDPFRITLMWRATTSTRPNYHVRLRLVDATGKVWWEDPDAHPVNGYYPTGAWMQDEIVPDFHEVKVEPFVPAGEYDLEVGLFVPFRSDGLQSAEGSAWVTVSHIQGTESAPSPLSGEVRSAYGRSSLLTSVERPGVAPPTTDAAIRVDAIGVASTQTATLTLVAQNGARVSTWPQTIRSGQSRLTFRAPDSSGDYSLQLSLDQPARCHWLAPETSDCSVGSIQVEGEAPGGAINFDNQVWLTESHVDRATLQPGESIHVDLQWRGLKTWDADYTVFVHLVGPDGQVHGQVDQWPVAGTLPTSSWAAGQVVDDPYTLALPPDAPRGQYQIEVGWYLLGTLRRLPVLDAAGRPSDDHVIIGELSVP